VLALFFIVGLLMLYYGADWLVKGSSGLARSFGIRRIVIGLTVVAFGTSAPELVISIVSSIQGKSMIAVGNVVGSNICNIALIIGLAALCHPITSHRSVITRDMPIMLGISLYLLLLSLDSKLGRLDGATLFSGIILYLYFNYHFFIKGFKQKSGSEVTVYESDMKEIERISSRAKQIILIVVGIACVVAGAQIVVDSAVKIMTILGVNEKFIGLTMVAFGTSLPELATSIVAAARKEMDISIGNLVGSNVFNILAVLGAASLIRPILIPGGFAESGLLIDYLVMILISFLPWLMMRKACTITRKDGLFLLCCYVGYVLYLILKL